VRNLLALAATLALAQTPATPTFEAASVRTNTSGQARMSGGVRGRTYTAVNMPLRPIIAAAYDLSLQTFRLLGGPAWIDAERFDVTGTLPEGAGRRELPMMLRALLADRFRLVVHTETRETPTYKLVVAGRDGKLGSGLRKADVDCETAPADRDHCQSQISDTIVGRGQTLRSLARMLSPFVGRQVVDQTGLKGGFDFDLQFPELVAGPGGVGPAVDAGGSVFTALQEQLGLKLVSTKGPLEFVVIDSVEHPTEN
jgi:uncharacterized protein (TIGR03435 family)